MKGYGSTLQKLTFLMSALIVSLCLFAAIASARLGNTLFDAEVHKNVLNQCDIYSQTGSMLKNSLDDYLKTLASGSPETLRQQEQLVSLIEKAITPDMLKLNIDSIADGLLGYFKSETRFLPDIYINPVQDQPPQELQTDTDEEDRVSGEALSKIDNINLSAILMYMNRSDITDKLSVVRLLYFFLSKIPILAVLLLAVLLLINMFLLKSRKELNGWVNLTALLTGFVFALFGISLLIYLYAVLPAHHSFISLSVHLRGESAVAYMQNWLYPSALFFIIAGLAAFILTSLFKLLSRCTENITNRFSGNARGTGPGSQKPMGGDTVSPVRRFAFIRRYLVLIKKSIVKTGRIEICGRKPGIKPVIAAISLFSILSFSYVYFGALKSEFLSKDLAVAVERMRGITAYSRVVFAQDAAVSTLELRMVDRETNTPVQGIYTNISGKSAISGNAFNEAVTSDGGGKSKTTLDIGSYKLSFDSTQFPDDYLVPPPYLFEMQAAGSTVITISLDKVEEQEPGIIEIQILDKDNLPVKGIELDLANTGTETGTPGESSAYSFTNAEGTAAFRTEAGIYRVSFLENGFPAEYLLPEPMEIALDSGGTARYSIKLAKKILPET